MLTAAYYDRMSFPINLTADGTTKTEMKNSSDHHREGSITQTIGRHFLCSSSYTFDFSTEKRVLESVILSCNVYAMYHDSFHCYMIQT